MFDTLMIIYILFYFIDWGPCYFLAILKEVIIEHLKVENKPPFAPTSNLNNSYVVVDEFCKENVNVEEIECIELTSLHECCEEKVKGIDLDWFNNFE